MLATTLALFFGYAGVLALEAVIGLVVYEFYGMDAAESWPVWLNLSVSAIVGALFFSWLNKKVTKAWCGVLLYIFSTVGGFLVVSWADLGVHVSYVRMHVGLTLKVLGTFAAVNLHFSLLAERMPPELQGLANTAGNIAGQLGRSVGPVFTMFVFEMVKSTADAPLAAPAAAATTGDATEALADSVAATVGEELSTFVGAGNATGGPVGTSYVAANAVLITQYAYVLVSIGVMVLSWRIIYVGKDALFPQEKAVDML